LRALTAESLCILLSAALSSLHLHKKKADNVIMAAAAIDVFFMQ
jgi:hypothetical protein